MEVRGNATVLFWPTLGAVLLIVKTWKQRSIAAAMLGIGVAVFTVPVFIRNIAVAGAWTPVASNWGENFYFGNHPKATGGVPYVAGIRTNIFDQIMDVETEASRRAGRKLDSLEAQRFWFQQGMNFIKQQPAAWLKLEWIKFRRMLQDRLPSGIYSYPIETTIYHPYLRFFPGYGLIFPLFIGGLLAMPFPKKTVLFLVYLAVQIGVLLLYWPEERYLLPIIPFLMIGAGCIALFSKRIMRSPVRVAGCAAALLLCLYVNIHPVVPGGTAAWFSNASSAHFARQEYGQATELALKAVQLDPNSQEAWTNLGSALYAQGNLQKARGAWLNSLKINPLHLMTLRNLAISYEKQDEKAALLYWERALTVARRQQVPSETISAIEQRIFELQD
jgi:tetratricopeptide (TPR) repeat protein